MFGAIKKIISNVKKLDENKILQQILDNSSMQADIIELNKEQMYDDGVDSAGVTLGEYSPASAGFGDDAKGRAKVGTITLYQTGEFHDSIKIKSEKEQILISADMVKPDTDLETIYPHALGLTLENLSLVRGWVLPIFREKTLQQIRA